MEARGESLLAGDTITVTRTTGDAPAWLAAAHGETLALHGQRDAALRAFDDADSLLPVDPVDPALPFVFLGDVHLERWRGNALAHLGDPGAIDRLTHALGELHPTWIRARAALLTDPFAHAAAGDRDVALAHARAGRRAAQQIHSDRTLRRLARLVLPPSRLASP